MNSVKHFWSRLSAMTRRRWHEWMALVVFAALSGYSLLAPLLSSSLSDAKYAPAFNAALSIGTGGVVSFVFYYIVNERLERRRGELVRNGALRAYRDAKRNIAVAVLHASEKGGRYDICADTDTIEAALRPKGFRALIGDGREGDEGFYAFQNQMSEETPEYDEIIFNLKSMGRAFDRLIDAGSINDEATYNQFVRLNALIHRIEHNGAGYDESKRLCSFIWEVFAGWSMDDGYLDYDVVERSIERS